MNQIFPSLYGNESVKALLSPDIRKKALSHAYIVEGPAGSGRHTLCDSIAAALLCTGNGEKLPCGDCPSCRKLLNGYSTDVYKLNKEDKATISVEKTRAMLATLEFAPDDGDYKFYYIEEAEKLTPQAQNALLKSLEEPPSYAVFFLITTDRNLLLETVKSRSQLLRTELFSPAVCVQWLTETPEGKKVSETKRREAAAVSRGALGAALRALDKSNAEVKLATEGQKLAELLCFGLRSEALLFAQTLKHTSQEFGTLLYFTSAAVRDMASVKASSASLVFYTDADELSEKCRMLSIKKLTSLYSRIDASRCDISQRFASASTVLATLCATKD